MAKTEKYSHQGTALRRVKIRETKNRKHIDMCKECFYNNLLCCNVQCVLYNNGKINYYYFIRK